MKRCPEAGTIVWGIGTFDVPRPLVVREPMNYRTPRGGLCVPEKHTGEVRYLAASRMFSTAEDAVRRVRTLGARVRGLRVTREKIEREEEAYARREHGARRWEQFCVMRGEEP